MSGDIQRSRETGGTIKKSAENVTPVTRPFDHGTFTSDFFTGCLSLVLMGLIIFVLIPVLLFIVKLSAALVLPLAFLVILVLLTATLGRIINVFRARWPRPRPKR